MDKTPLTIQLADHFWSMFDQITIPLLQLAHLGHPLFDLPERSLEITGHLIKGLRQLLDFISCPEFNSLV